MLEIERKNVRNQNQTTFYLIKMTGKLLNLNLVGFKDYFVSQESFILHKNCH